MPAVAQTPAVCPEKGHDWIAVQFDALQPGSASNADEWRLQQRVKKHLQVEFRAQNIDICTGSESTTVPLATLRIGRDTSNTAVVKTWANDALTNKQLSRRLSLAGLPDDAHAMAIALGASELLEASWSELRLSAKSTQYSAVPSGVQMHMAAREPALPRWGDLAFLGATEAFAGGVKQFGLDVQIAIAWTTTLDAVVRVGGRSSLSTTSAHGSVVADGWLVGAGVDYTIACPAPRLRLLLLGRADFMRLDFTALAKKGATASSAAGNTGWLSAGLGLDARVGQRVSLGGGFLAGRVLLPLSASDDGVRILGITKGVVAAHAGVKILF